MERLRVELPRERDDLLGRDRPRAARDDAADLEVLERVTHDAVYAARCNGSALTATTIDFVSGVAMKRCRW